MPVELIFLFLLIAALAAWALFSDAGTSSSRLERARKASTEVNRAVMRGDSGEVTRVMNEAQRARDDVTGSNVEPVPEIKFGPRGGRYTEEVTKNGRRYRRYF